MSAPEPTPAEITWEEDEARHLRDEEFEVELGRALRALEGFTRSYRGGRDRRRAQALRGVPAPKGWNVRTTTRKRKE